MKKLLFLFSILAALTSCKKEDIIDKIKGKKPLDGLTLVSKTQNGQFVLEIYGTKDSLQVGYNELTARVYHYGSNKYVTNPELSWTPTMNMITMSHSCPHKQPEIFDTDLTLKRGYSIFQMASNPIENWKLVTTLIAGNDTITFEPVLDVVNSTKRTLNTFQGTDGVNYTLAMVDPVKAKIGLNTCMAYLYKSNSSHGFDKVSAYTIEVDPRMPAMGNHGSPGNVKLTENLGIYSGMLTFTMSGYWRVNLVLKDANGTIVKGEEIAGNVTESSLFFEVEI